MADLITVIIPVRNAAPYLDACLDSVLGQSHRELQVIAVEDGSTDSSPTILAARAGADQRLEVVTCGCQGVSAARNAGIVRAQGKWISFVDADDILHPGALANLLKAALKTKAEVAVGGYEMFEGTPPVPQPVRRTEVAVMGGYEAMELCLCQKGMDNSVWAKLYKSAIFDEKVRFRPRRFEDLDIIYRIYDRAHRVCRVNTTTYYYRRHASSFIQNPSAPGRFDSVKVCADLLHYTQLHPMNVKRAAYTRTLAASLNALNIIWRYGIDKPELQRACFKYLRRYRLRVAVYRQARVKDRIGAVMAYLPPLLLRQLLRLRAPLP